ncbi:MAG: Tad domain-containing protein, partial [Planctomycetales bacterium]
MGTLKKISAKLSGLHRDQEGTITIVGVFSIMVLAMLLGMVLNVGFQADNKIKMQNAADSSAYSGGIVMARGMNSLAFTNHLLFDVFALTAFLREGGENHGEVLVPEILAAWDGMAGASAPSGFSAFRNWHGEYMDASGRPLGNQYSLPHLGEAIAAKVPQEQAMVTTFSDWARAFSDDMLPTLETILDNELIPEYQRALAETIPGLSQLAANTVSMDHGTRADGEVHPQRGVMQSALWTARVAPVGGWDESTQASFPVVDPVNNNENDPNYYLEVARWQRNTIAHDYLQRWNREKVIPFDNVGRMSQFYGLWNGFTCAQLNKLFDENQNRNLP